MYFYETAIGRIGIAEKDGYITNLYFENDEVPQNIEINETAILKEAAQQLNRFLAGEMKDFALPLAPEGTDFMKAAWKALQEIPYGKTATYKDIAIITDKPKACRAIGLANNRNPIPIFIPCHRVIGSNGKLTGYRGGLDLKKKLLDIEQNVLIQQNNNLEPEEDSCRYFQYGTKEIEYLKKKDKKLGEAIDKIGKINRGITPDPFTALASSIVGQQISSKAAKTVWNRLTDILGEITPDSIGKADVADIQSCGMSTRKAGYIKGIAEAALNGEVDFKTLHLLSDEEIIKKLSALQGVGVWTAEMLLIFSLNRPDVVSYGDLAIRRGMMNLYGLEELSKEQFNIYRKRYSPYGSTASLYLWAISVL